MHESYCTHKLVQGPVQDIRQPSGSGPGELQHYDRPVVTAVSQMDLLGRVRMQAIFPPEATGYCPILR